MQMMKQRSLCAIFGTALMNSRTPNSKIPDKRAAAILTSGVWLCYILCCADDTLYTGITNDLGKRLAAHDAGTAARYTRGRGPVRLVFVEDCADKSAALKREMKIKSLSRAKKLALIGSVTG
jgi:putative endonuclease